MHQIETPIIVSLGKRPSGYQEFRLSMDMIPSYQVWLDRLKAFARGQGLDVLFERTYESPRYGELRAGKPRLGAVIDAGAAILNIFSKSDVRRGDYHIVLRRS